MRGFNSPKDFRCKPHHHCAAATAKMARRRLGIRGHVLTNTLARQIQFCSAARTNRGYTILPLLSDYYFEILKRALLASSSSSPWLSLLCTPCARLTMQNNKSEMLEKDRGTNEAATDNGAATATSFVLWQKNDIKSKIGYYNNNNNKVIDRSEEWSGVEQSW